MMIAAACFFLFALLIHQESAQLLDWNCVKDPPDHNERVPWLAFIMTPSKNCSGALISKQFVITAANCVVAEKESSVRLNSEVYPVQYTYLTSNDSFTMDIALLKLKEPVIYKPYVRPICILLSDLVLKTGRILKDTRWGLTGSPATKTITKFKNAKCYSSFGKRLNEFQICAGYSNNDQCEEMGSPLGIDANSQNANIYILAGIQSYGALGTCVYSNILRYIGWIVGVVLEVDVFVHH
ncbi:chymotrypsinogen B2-like isoform X2 [Drosophila elegans]|uniref:chymotrypsinogen B2-like isoform X2 n=1 Tax=Drosophila elegans TaxID=30023 RepID=UPI0007E87DA3|nr:chymotrypsinogen B2-like isoform X2 [Drosophila elegans]